MKILLVRPWVNKRITTVKNYLFGEPMGLECFATLLMENEVEVCVVDFMVETKGKIETYLRSFEPDAVGITSQCTDVENVERIARSVKAYNQDLKVLVGGVQATCFPNAFFIPEIDFVFKSTTRSNVKALLTQLQGKSAITRIDGIYSKALAFINDGEFCYNEYVVPNRSCTERYRKDYKYVGYQPCAIIQTAYGCRNRCNFCIRWKLEGGQLREVPIETIIDQISELSEPYVMICDNDFLVNEQRLVSFCEELEKRRIKKEYICYGSVSSILEKPHLLKRLHEAGLVAVIVGYESFDDKQLSIYNKSSTTDDNEKATLLLKANGIACWGSFIVHPDWDKDDFRQLIDYIGLLKPELATFSPLVPHPMTPLYETYRSRLLFDADDYEKWNFGDVLIRPSKMGLRAYYWEVLKLTLKINGNWYSVQYTLKTFPIHNTLKMLTGFNTLFSVYLKNLLTRR
jgi:hopanoid C-3 methylase